MSNIITRANKGSPLNIEEMDSNFTNLDNNKLEKAENLSDIDDIVAARYNINAHQVFDRVVNIESSSFTNTGITWLPGQSFAPAPHYQIDRSSIKGVFNFKVLAGWTQPVAHIMLPDVNDIADWDKNNILTINVPEINIGGVAVHIVPSNSDNTRISTGQNVFYPRGVTALRAGSSASFVIDFQTNTWHVISFYDHKVMRNVAQLELNMVATITQDGTIANARGSLPFSVIKIGTGSYEITFDAVFFIVPLAPIVTITPRATNSGECITACFSSSLNSATNRYTIAVFIRRINENYSAGGTQVSGIDRGFDIMISCPTNNTSNLAIENTSRRSLVQV